jgi:putative transposase
MDQWTDASGIKLDFVNPGKPNERAFIGSFNGKFRNECLNAHWALSVEDARRTIEECKVDYNEHRPPQTLAERFIRISCGYFFLFSRILSIKKGGQFS